MKKCIGCGAILQTNNPNEIGFVNNEKMDYCQRCFKMIHYDFHQENDFMANNNDIINQLNKLEGQYVWVIDIFDLDSSLNSVLADFYKKHSCLVILNKCDLLPTSTNFDTLSKYLLKRLNKTGILSTSIITRGINDDFIETFDNIINLEIPIVITGLSNVGKSTIINQLIGKDILTTNRYPATTININELKTEKYHIFDTIGIINHQSVQLYLDHKKLKKVLPLKQIKPVVYQINSNQSFNISGLIRIDISNTIKGSLVFYLNSLIDVHRGKKENADEYINKHYGKDLDITIGEIEDFKHLKFNHCGNKEYFVCGLGFVKIVCDKCDVDIYVNKNINVYARECML